MTAIDDIGSGGRRWVVVAAGLATAAVGAALTVRPFTSLSVLVLLVAASMVLTGVATLIVAARARERWRMVVGLGWIAAGVLAVAWPDITTRGLALVVGIAMVVGGLLDVVGGIRGTQDQRLASILGGLASVIFGLLALSWPDVTLLVVAVVFGARTVLFGLRLAWSALRGDAGPPQADERPGFLRRAGHLVGAVVALVLALALAGLSNRLHESQSEVDAFYDAPDELPSEPGALVRSERYDRGVPDGASGYRILYTTTRADNEPAVASAVVIVPDDPVDGGSPVIAWAHGTTGFDRTCAPSVVDQGLAAGAFFSLDQVLEQGWALVATDYVGLGTEGPHPYLVGDSEARSVLDAVRAARQLDEVTVSDQTVVWGHSQGGGAALWTGQVAPDYAPDVELAGVAALAPASDLPALIDSLGEIPGGSLFASYVVAAYAATYPDLGVGDLVVPGARTSFEEISSRCLDGTALVSALSSITTGMSMFVDDYEAVLADRLEQNVPTGPIEAPLLVGQGEDDGLVLPEVQAAFVDNLCDSGQAVDYRTYEGRDHVPLVEADSPAIAELIEWTEARLAGEDPTPTC